MEQRPRDRDREHDTHEGPGLEGSAVRDLEAAPGDDDRRETAPQLVAERQHVGRRAAYHGVEHDVQEPLEVPGADPRGSGPGRSDRSTGGEEAA